MEKMFETAIREKYRWNYNGLINIEDLWDLPLDALDSIFKALNAKSKQAQEESLLKVKTKESKKLSNQIEIIKYIVETKQTQIAERRAAGEKAKQRAKIKEILAKKQDESLENLTPEQLQNMLAELSE